jgi:hypothetical protein
MDQRFKGYVILTGFYNIVKCSDNNNFNCLNLKKTFDTQATFFMKLLLLFQHFNSPAY